MINEVDPGLVSPGVIHLPNPQRRRDRRDNPAIVGTHAASARARLSDYSHLTSYTGTRSTGKSFKSSSDA
jgi:hypothetical protein